MCAYKLCSVTFSWRGIGAQIEKIICNQYPRLFSKFHRLILDVSFFLIWEYSEVYCRTDEWWSMNLDDIREHEEQTAENLREMIQVLYFVVVTIN